MAFKPVYCKKIRSLILKTLLRQYYLSIYIIYIYIYTPRPVYGCRSDGIHSMGISASLRPRVYNIYIYIVYTVFFSRLFIYFFSLF